MITSRRLQIWKNVQPCQRAPLESTTCPAILLTTLSWLTMYRCLYILRLDIFQLFQIYIFDIFFYYFETDWFPALLSYVFSHQTTEGWNKPKYIVTQSSSRSSNLKILQYHNLINIDWFYRIQNTKLNLIYFPGQYEFEPLEDETPSLSTKQVFPKSINPNINIVTFMLNLR